MLHYLLPLVAVGTMGVYYYKTQNSYNRKKNVSNALVFESGYLAFDSVLLRSFMTLQKYHIVNKDAFCDAGRNVNQLLQIEYNLHIQSIQPTMWDHTRGRRFADAAIQSIKVFYDSVTKHPKFKSNEHKKYVHELVNNIIINSNAHVRFIKRYYDNADKRNLVHQPGPSSISNQNNSNNQQLSTMFSSTEEEMAEQQERMNQAALHAAHSHTYSHTETRATHDMHDRRVAHDMHNMRAARATHNLQTEKAATQQSFQDKEQTILKPDFDTPARLPPPSF